MTKLLSGLCAAALVGGLAGGGGMAQDKKGTKTDPKSSGVAVVEINEGKDGKFRFNVRDAAGKLLAMSGPNGYATKDDAAKAVDALKTALGTAKIESGKKDDKKDGK